MKIKQPDLDSVIYKFYGPRLQRHKNIKTAYSFFTPFKHTQTDQVFYFYILKTDAKNHLSEGSISFALKKYNPFLSKVEFIQIDKNFDYAYFLVKTQHYLISLDEIIKLQKQCKEAMEKEYMIKTINFLIEIYKTKKWPTFPQLNPKSLGLNEQGQLKICDYEFYFKKNFQMRSLTENIISCINPMIKLSLFRSSPNILSLSDQYERLEVQYGEGFAQLLKLLLLDPMEDMEKQGVINGQGKKVNIKKIEDALEEYKKTASEHDANTTLNETYEEDMKNQNFYKKYNQSELLTNDSVKDPLMFGGQVKKSKHRKIIKISAILLTVLLITLGALLFFFYYSREIDCDVGTFKPIGSNQCLNCSEGCLRCESQAKAACFSCSGKMFLVLNNQNDTIGACETTCVGTVLKSNLCLKAKS